MDYSAQYQQQPEASQYTDPSQIQASYDQSTNPAYYPYQYNQDYYQQQQQHYSYNSQQPFSNPYQEQHQHQSQSEPISIYPPGVPIPASSDPFVVPQQTQWSNYGFDYGVSIPTLAHPPVIVQPSYRGRGKRGGRSYRGGGRGHRGRGQQLQPSYALSTPTEDQSKLFQGASGIKGGPSQLAQSSAASGKSALVQPPPRMAWCELCRVECNTPEVLEQHKNGKKHKKNLKVYEELQKLNNPIGGGLSDQTSFSVVKPAVSSQPEVEGYEQLQQGLLSSETVTGLSQQKPQENWPSHSVKEENRSITQKQKVEEAVPVEESAIGMPMVHVQSQGRGLKRKIRGGRGGKLMRSHNGSRQPATLFPLICELCNVKCESAVVFQSHLIGKKHLSNLKRYESNQPIPGQGLQSLYPALQALYPALQALCQPNTGASTSSASQGHQLDLHGLLGLLTQQLPNAIPQGQVLPLGTASTSVLPPASVFEAQDHQGLKLQGSASEVRIENAVAGDGRNQDHSFLLNTVSKPEEETDSKHEKVNLEFERKVMSAEEVVLAPVMNTASGDVSSASGIVGGAVAISK